MASQAFSSITPIVTTTMNPEDTAFLAECVKFTSSPLQVDVSAFCAAKPALSPADVNAKLSYLRARYNLDIGNTTPASIHEAPTPVNSPRHSLMTDLPNRRSLAQRITLSPLHVNFQGAANANDEGTNLRTLASRFVTNAFEMGPPPPPDSDKENCQIVVDPMPATPSFEQWAETSTTFMASWCSVIEKVFGNAQEVPDEEYERTEHGHPEDDDVDGDINIIGTLTNNPDA